MSATGIRDSNRPPEGLRWGDSGSLGSEGALGRSVGVAGGGGGVDDTRAGRAR